MNLIRKLKQLSGNFTTHDGVIVLTYHRVNDKLARGSLVVHPRNFKAQMSFLHFYRRQFEVIDSASMISTLAASPDKKETQQKRPRTKIVLTFDDGYRDNYLHVYPVLRRYRFPAMIFLTTQYIGTDFKQMRYRDVPWKRDYLNYQEIEEMAKNSLIRFGAHTQTHAHLTRINAEQAKTEIVQSQKTVNALSKGGRNVFCYPYGEFNETVKNIVRSAGFECAFSVNPGINYAGADLLEIKRIDVLGEDNFAAFKYKVTEKYAASRVH